MIVNKSYSYSDKTYLFYKLNIASASLKPFFSKQFDIEISFVTTKDCIVGPQTINVVKKVEYLGNIEDIKPEITKLVSFSSTNHAKYVNTSGFLSYICFYQKTNHLIDYEHIHKTDTTFKMYQPLRKYPISSLTPSKVFVNTNRKPTKVFDVKSQLGMNVYHQSFRPYSKLPRIFKKQDVYKLSPLKLSQIHFHWVPGYIENDKRDSVIHTDVVRVKYDLETFVNKKNIGSANYFNNIFYSSNTGKVSPKLYYNLEPLVNHFVDMNLPVNMKPMYGKIHYQYNPRMDLKDANYGYYLIGGANIALKDILYGPIEIVRIKTDSDKTNSFVTFKPASYPLCHIGNSDATYEISKGLLFHMGSYATPKDVTGITILAGDYIIPEIEWENTKDYISPVMYYSEEYKIVKVSVAEENFGYGTLIVHSKITTIKEYAYRDIHFNKQPQQLEGIPYYKDSWVGLQNVKYKDLMSTEKLLFQVSYIRPDKQKSMFVYEKVYRITTYKKVFELDWAQNLLSYKDIESELIFLRNGSIISAVISQQLNNGEVQTYSDIVRHALVFNRTYTKNAWILKTKMDGTYDWEDATVKQAYDYFVNDDVWEATKYFSKIGVYPFGVKHLLDLEYKNDLKAYLDTRKETRFRFSCSSFQCTDEYKRKKVTVFLDLAPINNTLEKTRFKSFYMARDLKGLYFFKELASDMSYIENFSNNDLVRITPHLFKYNVSNYTAKGLISFDLENVLLYQEEWFANKEAETKVENKYFSRVYSENITNGNIIYYQTFNNSIYHFVLLDAPINLQKYELEVDIHVEVPIFDNNNYELQSDLTIKEDHSNTDIYYLCEFTLNVPQDIKGATYKFNEAVISIINNQQPNVISQKGDIVLNTTLYNFNTYVSKYGVIWGQLYFPTRTQLANIGINMFNFYFEALEWHFTIPFNYYYVNTKIKGSNKPIPKKGFGVPPGLTSKKIRTTIDMNLPMVKNKGKNICPSPYKRIDRDGFDFEIERDDKLLIGNNLYDRIETIFDYNIEDVKSMFVDGREASDLGLLSKNKIEELKSKVNEKTDEAFDIKDFSLKSKDFGGNITDSDLKVKNQLISDGINKIINTIPLDSGKNQIEELIKQYPKYKQDIERQIDQTRNVSDLYVWNNVPARRPMDFVLTKSVHVKEGGSTFVRQPKEDKK